MYYWLTVAFILGTVVGSFLNVVIARMPMEKSLIWPGSRCGSCFQPIRWFDNIPLLSYLFLRGRCRSCGQKYSMAYFSVELVTGLCFAGLFYLEVTCNIHDWPGPPRWLLGGPHPLDPRVRGWLYHAVLMSLLIAASGCDLRGREIPFPLMLTGTLIGLVGATLMPWPWPWPASVASVPFPPFSPLSQGVYAWPFWVPAEAKIVPGFFANQIWRLPTWLPTNTWQFGLATGLAGMLMGTFLLRSVAYIFSKGLGREGLGLGDADLMMMVGSFLGWQMVVVAFFISVVPGMFFGFFQLVVRRDNSLPFGPSLALGTMTTCLCWRYPWLMPPALQELFFWGQALLALAGAGAAILLVMALFLRVMHMFRK